MIAAEKILGAEKLFDEEAFLERIHVKKDSRRAPKILDVVAAAKPHLHPAALYCPAEVQVIDGMSFTVAGIPFSSREVLTRLGKASQVFPNIVTCGQEIETYCKSRENILEQYVTMELCSYGCELARAAMREDMAGRYGLKAFVELFPGEGDWPLDQGRQIFELFAGETGSLEISMSDRGLPSPTRTAYGFILGER